MMQRGLKKVYTLFDKVELYLSATYYYIFKNLPLIAHDYELQYGYKRRTLLLIFSASEYVKPEVQDALNNAEEYLSNLCASGYLDDIDPKIRTDYDVIRNDRIYNNKYEVFYTVTLKDNPDIEQPRYLSLRFDIKDKEPLLNALLDNNGILTIIRKIYFNYFRDLHRIRNNYAQNLWSQKSEELKQNEINIQLDQQLLNQIDRVVMPEIF